MMNTNRSVRVASRWLGIVAVAAIAGASAYSIVNAQDATPAAGAHPGESNMVTVRTITPEGTLSEPHDVRKIELSDAEWKQRLTPAQYRILRSSGTERPFCGGLLDNKETGLYVCAGCDLPLFDSRTKFESGTGWPSFYRPAVTENVAEHVDRTLGMTRTEINCARCGGHLGHVFNDGPPPTGLRYCLNGEAMKFVKEDNLKSIAEPMPEATTQPSTTAN